MKIKEWVKEHEVTVMLVGAAVAGGIAVIAGRKLVNTRLAGGPIDHININIGKSKEAGMIGIQMEEVYKSKKEGQAIQAFWKPENAKKIADAIYEEVVDLTGETIEITVEPG